MSVVLCPWCQNEIPHEEGAEPERWCPICENELSGYRTLSVGLGDSEEDDEEEEDAAGVPVEGENLSWLDDGDLQEKNEALLAFEETVEGLLDEQDAVPECPYCREYMLDAGERVVPAGEFRPRIPERLGEEVLPAPFTLTVYVCPACFTVQQSLAEEGRIEMARRLSGRPERKGPPT